MSDTLHIASFVIQANPELLASVTLQLMAVTGVVIHASDVSGKIVATAETDSHADLLSCLETIRHTNGVYNANLVYHHADLRETLEQELN